MFNNVALDVAIGLVFIYLLYSLLATTVKEFIATIFSYRGRMLERGIEQMLDGKNYSYYWWDRLINSINKKNKENSKSKFSLKKSLFTNLISCHPLYIRSSENSRFSKKPSYLPASVFSDILIDVLKTGNTSSLLLKDIEASVDSKAADDKHPLNKDLQKILKIYIGQANGDLQRFKLLIENWYDETMVRVGGWYKQQAYKILLVIGFFLAVAFNVSTIDIVKKLSEDKVAREALVKNASEYVKQNANKFEKSDKSTSSKIQENIAATSLPKPDTTKPAKSKAGDTTKSSVDNINASSERQFGKVKPSPTDAAKKAPISKDQVDTTTIDLAKAKEQIDNISKLYEESIAKNDSIVGLGWGDYGFRNDSIEYLDDSVQFKNNKENYCKNHKRWFGLAQCKEPTPPTKPGILDKIWFVVWHTFSTPHLLLGFLITAFAISLGAPFWFDLLNKFMNLRASGAKPEDSTNKTASKTALLNQKPDPNAKG